MNVLNFSTRQRNYIPCKYDEQTVTITNDKEITNDFNITKYKHLNGNMIFSNLNV